MVAQLEASSGAKPSVGQLVSVIVGEHLQALKPAPNAAPEAQTEPDQPTLKAALEQLVERAHPPAAGPGAPAGRRASRHRQRPRMTPALPWDVSASPCRRTPAQERVRLLPTPALSGRLTDPRLTS
jgi:hypothetical protein